MCDVIINAIIYATVSKNTQKLRKISTADVSYTKIAITHWN